MTFLCLNQVYGAGKVVAPKPAAKSTPKLAVEIAAQLAESTIELVQVVSLFKFNFFIFEFSLNFI